MDLEALFKSEFDEHEAAVAATRQSLAAPFVRLVEACVGALKAGGKIVFFGDGGSAADAQHLAAELLVRYKADRQALAAIALCTDSSVLTAAANDFGYETIFARQVEALCRPGDVVIAISTSGQSANVVLGLEAAREAGAVPAALAGRDGGALVGLADPLLIVPSNSTARIQEMHIALGQMLCGALELELGLVSE